MLTKVEVDYHIEVLVDHAIATNLTMKELTAQVSRRYVETLLDFEGRNQVHAARKMGVHRNTLGRMLKVLHIKSRNPRGKRSQIVRAKQEQLSA